MKYTKLWMALSALIGALAAVAVTLIISVNDGKNKSKSVAEKIDITPAKTELKTIVMQADSERLKALEQTVEQLKNKEQVLAPEATTAEEAVPPDPNEERQKLEQEFDNLERRVSQEPIDSSWSEEATYQLENDLSSAAAEGGFSLISAECRTEMCRATMKWENYDAALNSGMRLPERAIPGLNCVTSIWLKEPANRDVPYSANLYLDCSKQRRGEVDYVTTNRGG